MTFNYFQNEKNKNWYWNLKADNGEKIADGAEGYKNKDDCIAGINLVKKNAGTATMKEVKVA